MKKLFFSIVAVCFMALSLSALGSNNIGIGTMPTTTNTKNNSFLENELKKVAVSMNQKLPMMVDKITRLDRVDVVTNNVTYNYTITAYTKADFAGKIDVLFQGLKANVTKSVCTNKQIKFLLDMGAILHYSYVGKGGAFLSKFTVSKNNCVGSPIQ